MCFAQGLGPAGDAKDVCVSCHRQSSLGIREGLVSYVFCPVALIPHEHLQVQNHHNCTRVASDVLVLGSGESVHKTPSKTFLVGESLDPFSNRLHKKLAGIWSQS